MRSFGFRHPVIDRVSLPVEGLSKALCVAHLTDLHFGNVTPQALQDRAVGEVNAARPDFTVLTGDFVCRGARHLATLTETLSALDGPKYAVLGNHDHWCGATGVRRALARAGVEVLDNAWTQIGELALCGMDDSTTGHHDPERTTRGVRGARLGLSHNPDGAPDLWDEGVGVVLSGHTHGGQFHWKAVTPGVYAALGTRYLSGTYAERGGTVYVNPGVGSSVLPWRVGKPARRTVALVDLTPALC